MPKRGQVRLLSLLIAGNAKNEWRPAALAEGEGATGKWYLGEENQNLNHLSLLLWLCW